MTRSATAGCSTPRDLLVTGNGSATGRVVSAVGTRLRGVRCGRPRAPLWAQRALDRLEEALRCDDHEVVRQSAPFLSIRTEPADRMGAPWQAQDAEQ